MAEIEVFEVAEDMMADAEEALEGLPEEAAAEAEAEIAASRAAVQELAATESRLQKFLKVAGSGLYSVAKFTAQNAAIGVILYGVNAGLSKKLPSEPKEDQESKKRMNNVIKALTDVIEAESKMNQKMLDWMTAHENDTINLNGIEVPLESILMKYIQPISKSNEDADVIVNSLQEEVNGKVQFKCPTADNIRKFIDITQVLIDAFTNLITFIIKHEDQVMGLQSFPIKQSDVIEVAGKLNVARALPLC